MALERPAYYRQSLDYSDGLCDNYIRSINQDSYGFVWVVTNYGLNRFNGGNFIKFTKENSGLETNELNCILQDPVNPDRIWIASRQNGLFCYNYKTGQISKFKTKMKVKDVTALSVASDNNIWITHYTAPPEILNPVNETLTPVYENKPDDFPSRIWCSAQDPEGNYIYLGHEFNGLTRINLKSLDYTTYRHDPSRPESLGGQSVYSIYIHSDGKVWTGTENGVSVFDPATEDFDHPETMGQVGCVNGIVKAIRGMHDGTIWATSDKGGIIIFSPAGLTGGHIPSGQIRTNHADGGLPTLTSPAPVALFEDSYGNRWIGYTNDGIDVMCKEAPFIFTYSPFDTYRSNSVYQNVWSITETHNGDLWIGGEKDLIELSGNASHIYCLPLQKDIKAPVITIFEDSRGNIWAGTGNSGAYRLNRTDSSFQTVKNIDREIKDIIETPDFGILAATHNGLFHIDDQLNASRVTHLTDRLPDRYATSLLYTSKGILWVGTFGQGAAMIGPDGKLLNSVSLPEGLPSNTINDIMECKDGKIWICTRDGAALYDTEKSKIIKVLQINDGRHSSNFKAIKEDESGKLWISAEDAISCYDPKNSVLSTYSNANKAPLSSFVEGSACFTKSGLMLFGSLCGLRGFKPSKFPINVFSKSKTRVTELSAHDSKGKNQNLEISIPINSDRISIPYNLNTFAIRFSNPDISMNGNAEVKYNLKGVNKVWSYAGPDQEALYRNLKPGTYRFQISTRYFGGEWSAPETLLTITITPPLFLTWWAKTLYVIIVLVAIGIILYFYKYKMNLEKNLAIEKENSKNNRLLNEERLMFYTNVTHELRTPLSLIIGPIEDLINDPELRDEHRKKLYTIRTSSMRLLNLINGILEFRKTETQNRQLEVVYGNLANFVREIGLRFKELNNNKNVTISIDVTETEATEMYYDPEIITTILNNLLGNAIKYTKSGTVTLSMKLLSAEETDYVEINVKDTGEGIAADELPHIFKSYYQGRHTKKVAGTGIGLALVKNLVEIHEGTITVTSEEGKGSTFSVKLKIDNRYPSATHLDTKRSSKDETIVEKKTATTSGSERLTFLIVEDDNDLRDYISNYFDDIFNVICAENGEEGLRLVKEKMPDIVVSDIMMPGMDGIELCNAIKNDITTSHIPVILLTAKDSMLDKEEGYNSGADSYITKPFSAKLLLSRIRNILDSRHRLALLYLSSFNGQDKDIETIE